jgi:hypothetical protein
VVLVLIYEYQVAKERTPEDGTLKSSETRVGK